MDAVIAIPVRNERGHIAACLAAIEAQRPLNCRIGVLLFLNNCTDDTETIVAALWATFSFSLRVIVSNHADASAGWARRCAMDAAASWLEEDGRHDGTLLTTDADSRVPPDWIARNLAALAAGADAVAGCLALDADDSAALPAALHARGALEARYEIMLSEITARLDPAPGDRWPTHACHSGASIATSLETYRAIGGMPDIPCGEDRAFFAAVLAHDGIVRHDPDIVVTTSGRLDGRASGGVADTMRLRCKDPDSLCDDRLEALDRVVARALLRRRLRGLHTSGHHAAIRRWAHALSIERTTAQGLHRLPGFGAVHTALEASARLAYHPLRPADLPRQIGRARVLLAVLRTSMLRRKTARTSTPVLSLDRTAAEAFD